MFKDIITFYDRRTGNIKYIYKELKSIGIFLPKEFILIKSFSKHARIINGTIKNEDYNVSLNIKNYILKTNIETVYYKNMTFQTYTFNKFITRVINS